jgi:hypothetical protein
MYRSYQKVKETNIGKLLDSQPRNKGVAYCLDPERKLPTPPPKPRFKHLTGEINTLKI